MKKNKTIYWTATIVFAVFMALGGIPDILMVDEAKNVAGHLGYPMYLLPFLGVAKILGSITILIPKFKTLKEWAYAGLSFDLIGATYSNFRVDGFGSNLIVPSIGILLCIASYFFWLKLQHRIYYNETEK